MLSFIVLSIFALVICSIHSASRVFVAIPVVAMAAASYFLSPIVDSNYYFLVNAALSGIVVGFLQIPRQTSLNVHIQIINGLAILAHALGHALWHYGHPSTIYNAIILALGVTEFARLIINTRMDAREYGARGGNDLIRDAIRFRNMGDSR